MKKLYEDVLSALQEEDKATAVTLCAEALEEDKISVVDLYERILSPALANVVDEYKRDEELIWHEHVRSGIVRTIIELCYPYVLQLQRRRDKSKGHVVVLCPEYEDHELGAKMVSDFFKIEGFDSTFIGARTPEKAVFQAIDDIHPGYICISITNYFNLVSAKRTIAAIKEHLAYEPVFVVGGLAFEKNPQAVQQIGAHHFLENYQAVHQFSKGAK